MKTTMISDLPRDLIEEILSRVPFRSMKALQVTCKKWDTLTKTTSFRKKHVAKSLTTTTTTREGEHSMMISVMNHNLYVVDPYAEPESKTTCLNDQVKIFRISHCDGLLLCILEEKNITSRLMVMNPYTSQTRWITPRYSHFPYRRDKFSYALGYVTNKSSRNYKFLRFIDYFYNPPEEQFFWYEIYDFDSDSWTTLDVTTPHWRILSCDHSVTIKGNTYWPTKERTYQDHYYTSIICFDFTGERFGPLLPLPNSVLENEYGYEYVTLSCVKEDKLAALFQHHELYPYELEIWITTKIEIKMVSWSKFLKLVTDPEKSVWVPHICGSFLIDEEKKVAMGFDYPNEFNIIGEDGNVRELDFRVHHVHSNNYIYGYRPHVCSYVPSLVEIKYHESHKRKREDGLEKLRFDQNMLKLSTFEKKPILIYNAN